MSQPCPCGRLGPRGQPLALEACCGRYLDGPAPAPDAESLMRSRYSAFVLERPAYLQATWHASQRPEALSLEAGVKWLGLEVKAHRVIGVDYAEVEFVARSRTHGRGQRLHERSRFVRETVNGVQRWWYVDGDML